MFQFQYLYIVICYFTLAYSSYFIVDVDDSPYLDIYPNSFKCFLLYDIILLGEFNAWTGMP